MKNQTLPVCIALVLSFYVTAIPAQTQQDVSYRNDISPILHTYCLSCHRPGGKGYEESGFDIRSYESLMKGGKLGPVIKPGKSSESTLIGLIEGHAHPFISMPSGKAGHLSSQDVALLKKWVDQGAKNN
jgi:mono/diheme cytochrome c family protein